MAGAGRIVYVMTDGAALPGAFSRLVGDLRGAGLLDGWITCGQAFGGDLEAVTVWTGLLAARELLDADVIVVADGPGNLGTDTTWGVSALGSGHALNAAAVLGGRPVPALRVSFADERERHRGLSHHSITILKDVCTAECNVPVPALEDEVQRAAVWDALRAAGLEERHHLVEVDGRPGIVGPRRAGRRGRVDGPRARGRSGLLPRRRRGRRPRRPYGGSRPPLALPARGLAAHMWAISCSTRSSELLNGSLQSTVRWAWSFSFRCTQSTV